MWGREPDRCCGLRKVEPLARALGELDAWVTGIRRDQTPDRADARVVERDRRRGALVKVNPLAAWTHDDVWTYVRAHDVKTGQVLWEARLGTSAQGFPVSFAIDGRQYIAVMSGLGGGSPRNVPAAIVPDIKIPRSGQALYVFALPDDK